MKRVFGGLAVLSIATALSGPSIAQDFDQLMLQRSQVDTPVGFQLRIPFGGAGKSDNAMKFNLGYRMKDSSGRSMFMPVTGYDQAAGGFHVLGVGERYLKDGSDKNYGYFLAAGLLGGMAVIAAAQSGGDKPCAAGQQIDSLTGLCTR